MWQSNPVIAPDAYPALLARLRALADGRSVQPGARINIPPGDDGRETAVAYARAGAEHLLLEFHPFTNFQDRLRQFSSTVLPQLKAI